MSIPPFAEQADTPELRKAQDSIEATLSTMAQEVRTLKEILP